MRATVLEGPRDIRVENVPDPTLPGPEGVIVTVERTAICGSDLQFGFAVRICGSDLRFVALSRGRGCPRNEGG